MLLGIIQGMISQRDIVKEFCTSLNITKIGLMKYSAPAAADAHAAALFQLIF
jgi:hypothetical protein